MTQNVRLQEMARSEREAHAELKQAQSRMVQSEKLAGLGQMVAGVAHEINNPLAFVVNNVAVLQRDVGEMRDLLAPVPRGRRPRSPASSPSSSRGSTRFRERVDMDYTPGEPRGAARPLARRAEADPADRRTSASSPGSTRGSSTRSTSTPASNRRRRSSAATPARRRSSSSWTSARCRRCLLRGQDQPGRDEPAHQRHRRLRRGGDGDGPDPAGGRRGSGSRSPTTAAGSTPSTATGSSTRSSPPSRSGRGPAWA